VETPEARAQRDASSSLWILLALPLVFISGIPVGFLMEDIKPGWGTAVRLLIVFGWFASTSIWGLCKSIRAARFGIFRARIGVVLNGVVVLGLLVLLTGVFFGG
jgi:hypothetical protein